MGDVGRSHMSIVSERGGRDVGAQILFGVLAMEVATSGAPQAARHSELGISSNYDVHNNIEFKINHCSPFTLGVGSSCEHARQIPSYAHHNSCISTTKLHVQRVDIEQTRDAQRIRTRHGHHRRDYVWPGDVEKPVRGA